MEFLRQFYMLYFSEPTPDTNQHGRNPQVSAWVHNFDTHRKAKLYKTRFAHVFEKSILVTDYWDNEKGLVSKEEEVTL